MNLDALHTAKRDYTTAVTVTCPTCQATARRTPAQRNDPKSPGAYCDGTYPTRHPIRQMLGPKGHPHA